MLDTIVKIGNILVLAIPVYLLASPNMRRINKDIMDNINALKGRSIPEDLLEMIFNATKEPDDLEDCMIDFCKCIGVHLESPFCGTTRDGKMMNFTSICHLAYENCKIGEKIWESTDDNNRYCEYNAKI